MEIITVITSESSPIIRNPIRSILILLLALSACSGGGSSSGPSLSVCSNDLGEDGATSPYLTVTLTYDATLPYLYGFRFYNAADNSLLLDSADYSSCFLDAYKTQDQPVALSLSIPLANSEIQRGLSISMTAYVKYSDNTEYESARSAPVTIQ